MRMDGIIYLASILEKWPVGQCLCYKSLIVSNEAMLMGGALLLLTFMTVVLLVQGKNLSIQVPNF